MIKIIFHFLLGCFFLAGCATSRSSINETITRVKFLDEYVVPYGYIFDSTVVGGFSGIDYDAKNNVYHMICDDRSDHNPARFYSAQIKINHQKIDTVIFQKVIFLKTATGQFYPNRKQNPFMTPDPESMRFDPQTQTFIWTDEGERMLTKNSMLLRNPGVYEINTDGHLMDSFLLPHQFHMVGNQIGPRQNGVFEGMTFSDDGKFIFVSTEEPLYNDGYRAGLNDSSALIRIIKFDRQTKKEVAQYVYEIDAVATPPTPPGAFRVNGVSDILYVGNEQLLIVERSFSTGKMSCTVKVYLAYLKNAPNVMNMQSLVKGQSKPIPKKLILNMDDLGIFVDNIEGVTFGPELDNRKRSLLFISDNNFNFLEKTQIFLFEIN